MIKKEAIVFVMRPLKYLIFTAKSQRRVKNIFNDFQVFTTCTFSRFVFFNSLGMNIAARFHNTTTLSMVVSTPMDEGRGR